MDFIIHQEKQFVRIPRGCDDDLGCLTYRPYESLSKKVHPLFVLGSCVAEVLVDKHYAYFWQGGGVGLYVKTGIRAELLI